MYDRLIEGFTADTFVGDIMGDNVGIGKNMGEYLNEFFSDDDDVQYLRFVGDSSTVTSQRSEGMDGVLGDNFNQVAETLVTNWSTEDVYKRQPLANGSFSGVRSPAKYGRHTSPSLPAGTAAASRCV